MLHDLRDRVNRLRFAHACSGILRTPPVRPDPRSNALLFSQLQHKDVLMALIAFKSFASNVRVGRLCILDDGSLTAGDRALLSEHLIGVVYLDLAEVRTPACPTRGCWERLLWIARLSRDHYVVQLDSDTLTLQDIPEVSRCIEQGQSFAIGTWDHQEIESMASRQTDAARHMVAQAAPHHVQLLAEANFTAIQGTQRLRYVRGCAGFAGFARGSVELEFIESISRQMTAALGEVWNQWGSEQVMSNIVVANASQAAVLPHPKYCDCTRIKMDVTAFIHFIGSCRFTNGVYQQRARDVIAALGASLPAEVQPSSLTLRL